VHGKCSEALQLGCLGGRHVAEKLTVGFDGLECGLGIRDFDDELKIIEKNLLFFSSLC
jgi:hypothetical protein